MTAEENKVMNRVLTIGPSRKTLGGMASVLQMYEKTVPGFRHLASNSHRGTFCGLFNLAGALLRMPLERLRGRNILHVHTATGKSFIRKVMIMYYGRMLGFKIIYHCHGGDSKTYFRTIGLPKAKRRLQLADKIVVLSNSWREYFESTFGFNNVCVIDNPVNIPANAPHPEEDEPLQLLFLGMIVDNKGIFDLLDVIAKNQDRWRGRVQLRIGGSGEVERLKHQIQESGISDMVNYIGWAAGPVKEMAFASSHILILPSYFEGQPISILEGMAHAKPIIATPVGGIPELVSSHDNGLLFPAGDRKALAEAIDCYLLNPELVERHGSDSRRKAMAYSPEAITQRLLNLYSTLL